MGPGIPPPGCNIVGEKITGGDVALLGGSFRRQRQAGTPRVVLAVGIALTRSVLLRR